MRGSFRRASDHKRNSVFILAAFFFFGVGVGEANQGKGLGAFSDPLQVTGMPADWVEKPIAYEEEVTDADLTIVLDQDIYHTFAPIIHRFATSQKLKISAREGTCGIAAGMLKRKTTDMGGFCCPPGKEDRLPGIEFHTIGIVAKAILLHKDNPISTASLEQVREIFKGKITNWSALTTDGGQPGPNWTIRPIGRFHCKNRPGHWYLLLPDETSFGPLLQEVGSIPDMISKIAADRQALGWEVLSMVEHYGKLAEIKPLKINGFPPTDPEGLVSKKYPLYRTYNVTTWTGKNVKNGNARKLVAFLHQEAAKIDSRFGFVPSARLKEAGWKFRGDELVAEP